MVPNPLAIMGKNKVRKRPHPDDQSGSKSVVNGVAEEVAEDDAIELNNVGKSKKKRLTSSSSTDTKTKINPKEVKERKQSLLEEDLFISGIVSFIQVPNHGLGGADQLAEEDMNGDVSRGKKSSAAFGSATRAKSVDELQIRLQKKLEELRGAKNPNKKPKKKLTKVERKQKAVEAKKLRKKLLKAANGQNAASLAANGTVAIGSKKGNNSKKPLVNSEGKIVFSKFDFTESKVSTGGLDAGKKQHLDPKSALQKIKKHKEKLKSLEAIGKTEKVKNIEDKTAWKAAIDKAEGVKLKDDVSLLKKSIKKHEQKKKSSKKKWDERNTNVEKKKEAKQNKRSENIKKRKDQTKQTKIKKATKKGRHMPGFR